jgi:hypothetical protein
MLVIAPACMSGNCPSRTRQRKATLLAANLPLSRGLRERPPRRWTLPGFVRSDRDQCPAGLLQPRAKGGVRETSAEPCLGDEHVDLSEALVGSVNFILQLSSLAVLGTRCGRSPGRR